MLTKRYDDALLYASELHRTQVRKGTLIPYMSHLLSVSALVLKNGGDEDQAIAGLLHDAVEDQGGLPTLEAVRERFGDRVANIVSDCTDSWVDPNHCGASGKRLTSRLYLARNRSRSWSVLRTRLTTHGRLWVITGKSGMKSGPASPEKRKELVGIINHLCSFSRKIIRVRWHLNCRGRWLSFSMTDGRIRNCFRAE